MRIILLLLILFSLLSCQNRDNSTDNKELTSNDTILVKNKFQLNDDLLKVKSRVYTYYWISNKDTLDFRATIHEWKRDSTLSLSLANTKPISFDFAIKKTKECISTIKKDFDVSKVERISFEVPLYFPDLATRLSTEYKQKFGRKNISYFRLNQFLLESSLNAQLNEILELLNKKTKRYVIEKFHLIDKEKYHFYLPKTDLTKYPEFTFNGISLSVELTDI